MRLAYLSLVFLHVLAAIVFVGGMAAIALLLVPAVRRAPFSQFAAALLHFAGVRFRTIAWTCLTVLVASGTALLAYRVGLASLASPAFYAAGFGRILAYKLTLVAVILVAGAIHDFGVGPRATAALMENPTSEEALRLRRLASLMGRSSFLLSLAVVFLAVMLVRGGL